MKTEEESNSYANGILAAKIVVPIVVISILGGIIIYYVYVVRNTAIAIESNQNEATPSKDANDSSRNPVL